MRIVLQRVQRASVSVEGRVVGQIGQGVLLLVGVDRDDTPAEAEYLANKCSELRVFSDEEGKMNRSLAEAEGGALVVSQFTLLGDCRKGRRPNFTRAAGSEKAEALCEHFVKTLRTLTPVVQTGVFGAMMEVELINDGPVTLILERAASGANGPASNIL